MPPSATESDTPDNGAALAREGTKNGEGEANGESKLMEGVEPNCGMCGHVQQKNHSRSCTSLSLIMCRFLYPTTAVTASRRR